MPNLGRKGSLLPNPLKYPPPNLLPIMLALHIPLNPPQSNMITHLNTEPPRSITDPQLCAAGILLRMSLKSEDSIIMAQKGLVSS